MPDSNSADVATPRTLARYGVDISPVTTSVVEDEAGVVPAAQGFPSDEAILNDLMALSAEPGAGAEAEGSLSF